MQGRSSIPPRRTGKENRAKEGEKNYRKNELWKLKFRSQRIAAGAYNAACQMDHSRQCNSNAAECNE